MNKFILVLSVDFLIFNYIFFTLGVSEEEGQSGGHQYFADLLIVKINNNAGLKTLPILSEAGSLTKLLLATHKDSISVYPTRSQGPDWKHTRNEGRQALK